ncbi:hypothetical protein ScPMuIL_001841 [Solemya velum]
MLCSAWGAVPECLGPFVEADYNLICITIRIRVERKRSVHRVCENIGSVMAPVHGRNTPKTQEMDKGWSWAILFGCFCIYCVTIGSLKTFGVLYRELLDLFSAGAGNTAWVPALGNFLLLSLGPVANLLSEMFSYRLVVMSGGFILAVGYFCSSFVPHMELMFLTYGIIGGIGLGLIFAPTATIVSLYFEKRRALANGIMVSGSGIGAFTFPFLYQFIITNLEIRGTFRVLGGLVLIISLTALLFRQPTVTEKPKSENKTNEPNDAYIASDEAAETDEVLLDGQDKGNRGKGDNRRVENESSEIINMGCCGRIKSRYRSSKSVRLNWSLLKNQSFLIMIVSFLFASIGYPANFILIPSHTKAIKLAPHQQTLVLSLYGVGEIVGRLFFGWFADLGVMKRKFIYAGCMFISGFAAIIVPFSYTFEAMITYSVVCGVFAGSFWAILAVIIVDIVGIEKFPGGFGLTILCIAIAGLIGPPIMGWLEDGTGSWDASFWCAGCTMLFAGLLALLEPIIVKALAARGGSNTIEETTKTAIANGIEVSTNQTDSEQTVSFLKNSEPNVVVQEKT